MASQRILEAKKAQALKDLADLTAENNRLLRLLCQAADVDPDAPALAPPPAPEETPVEAGEQPPTPAEKPAGKSKK